MIHYEYIGASVVTIRAFFLFCIPYYFSCSVYLITTISVQYLKNSLVNAWLLVYVIRANANLFIAWINAHAIYCLNILAQGNRFWIHMFLKIPLKKWAMIWCVLFVVLKACGIIMILLPKLHSYCIFGDYRVMRYNKQYATKSTNIRGCSYV